MLTDAIGIAALATTPGEIELDSAALAAMCSSSEAAILRSKQDRVVRVTAGPAFDLALDAARRCLALDHLDAGAVGAIIYFGGEPETLRLQDALGAHAAFTISLGGTCAEIITALQIARALVRERTAPNVLIVSGQKHGARHTDTVPTERNYRELLGDAGAALLVRPTERLALLGFGHGTFAGAWDYAVKHEALVTGALSPKDMPVFYTVFHDSAKARADALSACLAAAGLRADDVDHVLISNTRITPVREFLARSLGIPAPKIFADHAFAHMGRADVAFDLGRYLEACGEDGRGRVLLVCNFGIGVFRFAALRA